MSRSKFRTTPVRSDVNGEHRLQMRLPSGAYTTVAHCTDESMARTLTRLLNQRSAEKAAAKDAREFAQRELLPVDHSGLHPRRLKSFKDTKQNYHPPPNAEAFYAAKWKKWNSGEYGGSGNNVLHYILCSEKDQAAGWQAVAYTRRDAVVAASVVQWLGTNVGRGFVQEVEDSIRKATERQHELGHQRRRARQNDDTRTPLQRRKATLDATRKRLAPQKKGPK